MSPNSVSSHASKGRCELGSAQGIAASGTVLSVCMYPTRQGVKDEYDVLIWIRIGKAKGMKSDPYVSSSARAMA